MHTLAAFIDLKSAYDSVWRAGAEAKLHRIGIQGRMYCWMALFLRGRKLQAKWNGIKDRPVLVPAGVPQGSVISPLLFLIYINDFNELLPQSTQTALFADDIALWVMEPDFKTIQETLQRAVRSLESWATN